MQPLMPRVARLRTSLRRSLTLLALALLLVLGAGYAWYLDASTRPNPAALPDATAIAVLTGGPDRVEVGLHLAARHPRAPLIISGAGATTDLATLAHGVGMEPFPFLGRTTVGRDARSTRGNAREVAAWALAADLHTITVVTAGFHMPRALLELRRALPTAELIPYAVEPRHARFPAMLREYAKLVGAWLGLSAYGRSEPPPLDEEGPAIQPPEDGAAPQAGPADPAPTASGTARRAEEPSLSPAPPAVSLAAPTAPPSPAPEAGPGMATTPGTPDAPAAPRDPAASGAGIPPAALFNPAPGPASETPR